MNRKISLSIKQEFNLKPLPRSFYSTSAVFVAKELLGKYFYSFQDQSLGRIVETEAYPGNDPINHGIKKKTKKNSAMFLPPGYCYVYFVYYRNLCFNISVEKRDTPSVVLIRAIEPLEGIELISKNRKQKCIKNLTNGPSKICQAFGIEISDNRKMLTKTHFGIFQGKQSDFEIIKTNRIGVKERNPKEYRFYIKGNPFVSRND
ncbi:MAG TPA: DNA-3-methyladenine glycosylase [Candidatus Methanoperedens sp.]